MFHEGFGFFGMWFGYIFWIAIIAIIIYLLIKIANQKETPTINQHNESALDILKKRYARGEISKEEFEQIKNDIN